MAWLGSGDNLNKSQITYAKRIAESFKHNTSAIVPSLWIYEVSNVLTTLIRHKYINEIDAQAFIKILKTMPIEVIQESNMDSINSRLAIASQYNLSAYDASYLAIALANGYPIATFDKKLIKAAKANDIYYEI